jgi:type II secretory pathway component PulJ
MVALVIMAAVAGFLSAILVSSNRIHRRTTTQAELQSSSRQAVSLLTAELRQAGADPSDPPVGIVAIVSADSHSVRVRADLNADGAISTAEPSEDVTYTYDANAQRLTRDPGSGAAPLLEHVMNMRFTYFDATGQPLTALPLNAADRALVRSIGLSLTCEEGDSQPFTHTTQVTLRNVGS